MSDLRKWKALVESASKLTEDPVQDADYTDHEVSMAKSQMLSSMKSINRIAKHLASRSESEGLEGWTASKLTMAEDYLQVVADYFDGQEINEGYKVLPPMDKEKYQARDGLEGPFSTLSGKVVYYDPKAGKYYDPDTDMYMSYDEFRKYDDDYKGMKEEQIEEAHQIDWPDKDEDGDSEMEQHAYNAIRHGMHAYDAYDHVYSMSRERDWLSANKDDIIKMFAQYGLKTESLDEDTVKYEDHYDDRVVLTVEKDKLLYNGNPIQNYDWNSSAKDMVNPKFYARAKSWEEVHGYLARFLDNPKGLQAAVRQVFNTNDEGIQVNETMMFSEAQFDEAAGEKDACYHKVKSRYKVWPSAYASGALVKCRKVGAKNWGNSKKK